MIISLEVAEQAKSMFTASYKLIGYNIDIQPVQHFFVGVEQHDVV